MLKRLSFILAFLVVITHFNKLFAQDIQLSQFYRADLMLNPAFAGRTHHHRVFAHERVQWPGAPGKYITSVVGYDSYAAKQNSGYGLYFVNDIQGKTNINTNEINFLYSYDAHLNDEFSLRMGLQATAVYRNINYKGLIFPGQLTSDGVQNTGAEDFGSPNVWYGDISSGAIMYSEKFWFGYAAHHLPRPSQAFILSGSNLPIKHSITTGYKIELGGINPLRFTGYVKPFYVFPMIHYKFQGKSDQLDLGLHGMDDQLMFGLWYRGIPLKKYAKDLQNNESIILMAGWQLKHISFSYSYDIIMSKLGPVRPRGAHELNVTYIFFKEQKHNPAKKLPCPDFNKVQQMQRKRMSSYDNY